MAPVRIVSRGSLLHPAPTAALHPALHPTEWLLPLHSPSPFSNELSRLSGPGLLESSHTPADFKPVIISSTAPLNCHWLFPAFFPLFFPFLASCLFSIYAFFIRTCGCQHTQDGPKGFTSSFSYQFTHPENGIRLGKYLRKSTTPQTDTGTPLPLLLPLSAWPSDGKGLWMLRKGEKSPWRVLKAESEGAEERPSSLRPFILYSALPLPPALSTPNLLPDSCPLTSMPKKKNEGNLNS